MPGARGAGASLMLCAASSTEREKSAISGAFDGRMSGVNSVNGAYGQRKPLVEFGKLPSKRQYYENLSFIEHESTFRIFVVELVVSGDQSLRGERLLCTTTPLAG